jgi:hypothetical protein
MKTFTWQEFKKLVNSKEYVLSSRRGLPSNYNLVETGSTIIRLIQDNGNGDCLYLYDYEICIYPEHNENIQFDEKTKTFHLIRKYDIDGYDFKENFYITLYKAVDFS